MASRESSRHQNTPSSPSPRRTRPTVTSWNSSSAARCARTPAAGGARAIRLARASRGNDASRLFDIPADFAAWRGSMEFGLAFTLATLRVRFGLGSARPWLKAPRIYMSLFQCPLSQNAYLGSATRPRPYILVARGRDEVL